MKDEHLTEIVCKRFCAFYKEGKEELQCGTFLYLRDRYSPEELGRAVTGMSRNPSFTEDKTVSDVACSQCDFRKDGCDYREGLDSPPCGGYVILEQLIRKGLIPGIDEP